MKEIFVVEAQIGEHYERENAIIKAFFKLKDAENYLANIKNINKIIVEIKKEIDKRPLEYFGKKYDIGEFNLPKPEVPYDHNHPTKNEEHKKRKIEYNKSIEKWRKEYDNWWSQEHQKNSEAMDKIKLKQDEYFIFKLSESLPDWNVKNIPAICYEYIVNFTISNVEIE